MAQLGIYEKALPKNISWENRLLMAKKLGFDFVEMSIDETDERLARLDWTKQERIELIKHMQNSECRIASICLSGHRRFPFGSLNQQVRSQAASIMQKAIILAKDLGVRTIQLAGYDVYYEDKSVLTRQYFIEELQKAVKFASSYQVMLSIEIMDDRFINSITKFQQIKKLIPSPWLQVYPDLGNLSAWPTNDVGHELEIGIPQITAVHIKDTLEVTPSFPGKFKEVPFGTGSVDFDGCFQTLQRLNYDGAFVLEMWSETSNHPKQAINDALQFILPKLKGAGYFE